MKSTSNSAKGSWWPARLIGCRSPWVLAAWLWAGALGFLLLGGCGLNEEGRQRTVKTARLQQAFSHSHFVAYTPADYNPLPGQHRSATPEGIRSDLRVLREAGLTGLVTYSCNPNDGLDQIVPIASELGMTVILGIWDVKSVREIQTAVDLAIHHTNVVGMLVGNETLLRGGAFEDLEAAVNLVRAALPNVPVSTSEPITSYGNEDLRKLGDFHAPNMHWIFQGRDLADAKAAVAWLRERCQALREMRNGARPILVKEHGYPSGGNPAFTPQLQQQYWETLIKEFPNSDTNAAAVFEAFSETWKVSTAPAGAPFAAAERDWGCWDEHRQPKPVVESLRHWR